MITSNGTARVEIHRRFARHVSSGKAAFYEQAGIDFILGKREGVYMYDLSGRKLINCHCNGGVFNLGHHNPRVIHALQNALETLDIGNHHLVSEARAGLGERLAEVSPGDLNRVVFESPAGRQSILPSSWPAPTPIDPKLSPPWAAIMGIPVSPWQPVRSSTVRLLGRCPAALFKCRLAI